MSHPPDMRATPSPGPSDAALRPPGDPGLNPDPRGRPFRDDDPTAAGVGLPQVVDQVGTAINKLTQARNDLERPCDPLSAPDDDTPMHQFLLAMAHGCILDALGWLGELADRFPTDRPAPPRPPGEEAWTPGLAAADPGPAAACESQHGPPSVKAGASHAPPK